VALGIGRQSREALQEVGDAQMGLAAGTAGKRSVGAAFGLFMLTMLDRCTADFQPPPRADRAPCCPPPGDTGRSLSLRANRGIRERAKRDGPSN